MHKDWNQRAHTNAYHWVMNNIRIWKPEAAHTDERGTITDLINTNDVFHHIGLITFTEGAVRANHYHKQSDQYDYIVEGRIEFATKDALNPDDEVSTVVLETGDMVCIPKNTIHAYHALEPSPMINMTTVSRENSGYEDDTICVDSLFE